jgi:hypothetical protein
MARVTVTVTITITITITIAVVTWTARSAREAAQHRNCRQTPHAYPPKAYDDACHCSSSYFPSQDRSVQQIDPPQGFRRTLYATGSFALVRADAVVLVDTSALTETVLADGGDVGQTLLLPLP